MTDRELLELAAKAAGYNAVWDDYYLQAYAIYSDDGVLLDGFWDPLTDDGDALRLAVDLGIHIAFYGDHVAVQQTHTKLITEQRRDGDVRAATRRAIVRAAAEIGRNMLSSNP